jgi:hypothetical protein
MIAVVTVVAVVAVVTVVGLRRHVRLGVFRVARLGGRVIRGFVIAVVVTVVVVVPVVLVVTHELAPSA